MMFGLYFFLVYVSSMLNWPQAERRLIVFGQKGVACAQSLRAGGGKWGGALIVLSFM